MMIGKIVSHYKILEQLGEGGMGVVYRAEDTRLNRPVALKFLSPELTGDPGAKARFISEAKAASALDHPNVCGIYEIDESDDGRLFIAMSCYDGETLKERIRKGPLPVEVAVDIAREIALGLSKAHEKGIIHRDIKPANIMITRDGPAKILDFGLAKLTRDIDVTRSGIAVGTPAYMSPEQARGEKTTNGADVWGLGVVLYEMIAGRPPFCGDHEQAVVYSILNEEPPPLSKERAGVPGELERLVGRCLAKDPAARYQDVRDVIADLDRIRDGSSSETRLTGNNPKRRSRVFRLAGAAIILTLVVAAYVRFVARDGRSAAENKSKLVVLPFENLGDPGDEYFADGMTEELTSRLAALRDIRIISRTSAVHYKGLDKSVREIGDELGVDYILEGAVSWENKSGGENLIRVTPRLIRVEDDSQMWSAIYERELDAIFDVQSRIAGQVAEELDLALSRNEQRLLNARPTENALAYQLYLRGIDYILFGHRPERNYREAQTLFEQAVSVDPDFALAYAKLSETHRSLYFFGYERTAERLEMAKRAIDKALEIDPDLPEARRQLGYYYYQGLLDFDRALEQFSAVARDLPNDARMLQDIALIWRRQGRLREALANQRSAFEMSPTDAGLCIELAYTNMCLRKHEEALRYCDEMIDMAPGNTWGYLVKAIVLMMMGNVDAAKKAADACPDQQSETAVWTQFSVCAMSRDFTAAHRWLERVGDDVINLQSAFMPVSLLHGLVYRRQGERERALESFESAIEFLENEVRKNPEDARIHGALGLALAGAGENERAIAAGRRAIELYPVEKDALLGVDRMTELSRIYAITGATGECLETIREILSMPDPYTIQYFDLHPDFDTVRETPGYKTLHEEFHDEKSIN